MIGLIDRIRKDGVNLGGGILKVDGFVNHQVDPALMWHVGHVFALRCCTLGANKILTAEVSGVAPALMTGLAMRLPVVYARKSRPITMPNTPWTAYAPSHTKGESVSLMVSPEFLGPDDRVLVIDDFLARGETIRALIDLVFMAGATLVGIGALIEKRFEKGRDILACHGVPIEALAIITSMDNGMIEFADD